MTASLTRSVLRSAVAAVLVLFTATPGWSQTPGAAKDGGFAGLTVVPQFTFDGVTFDGQTVYKEVDGEELAFLPRVDEQPMWRGILGYRQGHYAIEVSYDRSALNGTFEGVEMDTTFQAVNVNGRYFFAPRSRVQPHVLFGGSFPWLQIKNSSLLDEDLGDSDYKGWGVNAEVGVTVFPHRQFGIGVGYAYRAVWFDRMTGVSDTLFELRPRFREESGALSVTGTITF